MSNEANDLIHRLLKKNPTERIRLNEILQHPFMKNSPAMTHCKNQVSLSTSSQPERKPRTCPTLLYKLTVNFDKFAFVILIAHKKKFKIHLLPFKS